MGFQGSLKEKVNDLVESLNLSNGNWNDWEDELIRSVDKWERDYTPAQAKKIIDLWEKL